MSVISPLFPNTFFQNAQRLDYVGVKIAQICMRDLLLCHGHMRTHSSPPSFWTGTWFLRESGEGRAAVRPPTLQNSGSENSLYLQALFVMYVHSVILVVVDHFLRCPELLCHVRSHFKTRLILDCCLQPGEGFCRSSDWSPFFLNIRWSYFPCRKFGDSFHRHLVSSAWIFIYLFSVLARSAYVLNP